MIKVFTSFVLKIGFQSVTAPLTLISGIATPPESPYRGILSDAILELQELGKLHELKNLWWSIKKGGGKCGPKEGGQKGCKFGCRPKQFTDYYPNFGC